MKFILLTTVLLSQLLSSGWASATFVHCYDFGCKSNQSIEFNPQQWQQVSALFAAAHNEDEEKQSLRKAIALMETFSGELTGTSLDVGGNYPGSDIPKQMDCIDESTNTFQYLYAIESLNLLKWHTVGLKKRRIVWFMSHWTAVIEETRTSQKFAVDSWYRDNGELPYIQPLADWQVKNDFTKKYNPEN
jgi:hypothetical protein